MKCMVLCSNKLWMMVVLVLTPQGRKSCHGRYWTIWYPRQEEFKMSESTALNSICCPHATMRGPPAMWGWLQGGASGFNTGNEEKLSSTQGISIYYTTRSTKTTPAWQAAWLLLSFSLFPVSNPAAPLWRSTYERWLSTSIWSFWCSIVLSAELTSKMGCSSKKKMNIQISALL